MVVHTVEIFKDRTSKAASPVPSKSAHYINISINVWVCILRNCSCLIKRESMDKVVNRDRLLSTCICLRSLDINWKILQNVSSMSAMLPSNGKWYIAISMLVYNIPLQIKQSYTLWYYNWSLFTTLSMAKTYKLQLKRYLPRSVIGQTNFKTKIKLALQILEVWYIQINSMEY